MASRPLFRPEVVANALSMSTTGSSLPSNINQISAIGYTVTWGSGASGTFTVEVSNDYVPSPPGVVPNDPDSGTWVALTLSTPVATTGTAGSAYIDIVGISAAWIRITFTNTASSGGTWTAVVAGKVL
jgi:hypothetical protein